VEIVFLSSFTRVRDLSPPTWIPSGESPHFKTLLWCESDKVRSLNRAQSRISEEAWVAFLVFGIFGEEDSD